MHRTLLCLALSALVPSASALAATEVVFRGGRVLEADSVDLSGPMAMIKLPGGGVIGVEKGSIASLRTVKAAGEAPDSLAQENPPVQAQAVRPAKPAEAETDTDSEPAARAPEADAGKKHILQMIAGAAKRYGVDPLLLQSVIQVESSFNPSSVSPKGAMGLAQLMPATARDLGVADPFDPDQAVDAAARHLRKLLDESNGEFVQALAAYNAGEGAVSRYGGLPPYRETIHYIEKVLRLYGTP